MSFTVRGGNEDPDAQIVGTSFVATANCKDAASSGTFECGICALNLQKLTVPQRVAHYNQHLEGDPQGPLHIKRSTRSTVPIASKKLKVSPAKILRPKGQEKDTKTFKNGGDVFWYCTLPTPPPSNYTPGLIPLLQKSLWSSHAHGTTQRAALCYERSVHVGPFGTWDRSWGCGYRNFLMVCTALMDQTIQPEYLPLLNEPIPPGIRNLQVWIEDSWEAGFDEDGAKELKNLVGSKKWIGTADLWVAFTYRGIPAELVDFDLKNQPRGAEVVIDWIVDYFSPKLNTIKTTNVHDALRGASPITVTDRMPLILQHNGHSRTIVGYEMAKNKKVTLLAFDPSTVTGEDMRNAAISAWSLSTEGHDTSRKRPPGSPATTSADTKRHRFTSEDIIKLDNDDEIFNVEGSRESRPQEASKRAAGDLSLLSKAKSQALLDKFRLEKKKLEKKQYQILYFPMTEPLTEEQRMSRKTPTSIQFC
ncbi:putative DUF1671-domain-containing protein [Lyophyllum shimeji]|uniref:DUF1671-domain-containing protein n=1 Tax=Lyophyllum shimeji TaxID=47721 RepID=A0A9P3PFM4_LYOSH|nr:putative DUF1671-domain-containing protein [Lyophyllum shimeji]